LENIKTAMTTEKKVPLTAIWWQYLLLRILRTVARKLTRQHEDTHGQSGQQNWSGDTGKKQWPVAKCEYSTFHNHRLGSF
jgi:hypothetical protein